MTDSFVRCERENIEGLAAKGSYLSDILHRCGVRDTTACDLVSGQHFCNVRITEGSNVLSELAAEERELLGGSTRTEDERLACFAKIVGSGDITIMTQPQEKSADKDQVKDKFVEEFTALPLEKKLASLFRMEAVALGETVDYVISSPLKVVAKIGDVMAEFGIKLEAEAKKAAKPKDPSPESKSSRSGATPRSEAKRKATGRKKPADSSK
jgi:ferredoxin